VLSGTSRILRGAGFEVNVLFGPENNGVKDWLRIPEAQFNLVVSPWVGVRNAEHLQKNTVSRSFTFLKFPSAPKRQANSSVKLSNLPESTRNRAKKFIEQENGIYYYYLEHFSEFFAEYWYGMPSEFAITADSAYTLAYTKFLADQIGLIPRKAIVSDDPPQKFREQIEKDLPQH
jgi:Nitrogenase component 1 type Oxidoreductase.